MAGVTVGHLMRAIERALEREGPTTASELCAVTDSKMSTVHDSLRRMMRLKMVRRERGWRESGKGALPYLYIINEKVIS